MISEGAASVLDKILRNSSRGCETYAFSLIYCTADEE